MGPAHKPIASLETSDVTDDPRVGAFGIGARPALDYFALVGRSVAQRRSMMQDFHNDAGSREETSGLVPAQEEVAWKRLGGEPARVSLGEFGCAPDFGNGPACAERRASEVRPAPDMVYECGVGTPLGGNDSCEIDADKCVRRGDEKRRRTRDVALLAALPARTARHGNFRRSSLASFARAVNALSGTGKLAVTSGVTITDAESRNARPPLTVS
jgi:hypothetical protein